MINAETRNRAFALFLEHHSLRAISETIGVSKSALETWCRRESWVNRRKLIEGEARAQFIQENFHAHRMKVANISDALYHQLCDIVAERDLWMQGRIAKRRCRFSSRDLLTTAKALVALRHGDLGQ